MPSRKCCSPNGRESSTPGRYARWEVVEDLAQQIVTKISASRTSKYADLSEVEILGQFLDLLVKSDFGTEQEMRWLIRRAAQVLGWPVPMAASEKN